MDGNGEVIRGERYQKDHKKDHQQDHQQHHKMGQPKRSRTRIRITP
jgi:hypothetical protein